MNQLLVRLVSVTISLSLVVTGSSARLVFPKGSDMGYIVADDPSQSPSALQDLDPRYNELKIRKTRGERPPQSPKYSSLWLPHSIIDAPLSSKDVVAQPSTNDLPSSLVDAKHGVRMGVSDTHCDDAKTGLLQDWSYSPANYTCYTPRAPLPPPHDTDTPSVTHCDLPAPDYSPQHHCMDMPIEYSSRVPSYGDHRPLWPQFGEYKFVPSQRWLHNIEHGAVVMLYHPCTAPHLVAELRTIVTDCLYKHIITPYTPLTPQRPLALVAWGCVLEMSHVDPEEVRSFIKANSLKGPEGLLRKQGLFTEGLIRPSPMPEGKLDTNLKLCSTKAPRSQ